MGMELYYAEGPGIVEDIRSMDVAVFLDLKFHDIPNTVENAVAQLSRLKPAFMTVHAQGGREMMARAAAAARASEERDGSRPALLAITLLTSIDGRSLREELMVGGTPSQYVVDMALLTKSAGIDGVVASAQEARLIRRECGENFIIVTPGIRPSWYGSGDQRRVATPAEAISAGADYIVVGRPVTRSPNPLEAALRIIREIEECVAARACV